MFLRKVLQKYKHYKYELLWIRTDILQMKGECVKHCDSKPFENLITQVSF